MSPSVRLTKDQKQGQKQQEVKPKQGKTEDITIITRDSIRVLHPRGKNELSRVAKASGADGAVASRAVISSRELDRIMKAASVAESPEVISARILHEKANAAEEALRRKMRLEEFEKKRTKNLQLSELEQENKQRENDLRAKCQAQLYEEISEVKQLGKLIVNAKCMAVRDMQLAEKKAIKMAHEQEERKIAASMEQDRIREIQLLEERDKRRSEKMRLGAQVIEKQIQQRKEAAMLEAERRQQETNAAKAAYAARIEAERAENLRKQKEQKELMKQILLANKVAIETKQQAKLRDQEEDERLLAYAIEKNRIESEREAEAQERRCARERELARLLMAQKKLADKAVDDDALRARRAAEAYEREWRRKEREAVERRAREEASLQIERVKQQAARENAVASEVAKMRAEFEENLKLRRALEERLENDQRERHSRNMQYSNELRRQISEKESAQRRERDKFFLEGVQLKRSQLEQRKLLDSIRRRKIQEALSDGVPPKYCQEVMRKALLEERRQKAGS